MMLPHVCRFVGRWHGSRLQGVCGHGTRSDREWEGSEGMIRSFFLRILTGQKGRNKKIDKRHACLHISSSDCRKALQVTKIESLHMIWMHVSRLRVCVLPQLAQRLTSFKKIIRLSMHDLMHSTTHNFRSLRRYRLRSNLFSCSQCFLCTLTRASVSTENDIASILCQVLNTYVAFTQTRSSSLSTANGVHTPAFTTRGGVTVHRYAARMSKCAVCLQLIWKTFSIGQRSEMDASFSVDRFSTVIAFRPSSVERRWLCSDILWHVLSICAA